MSACLVKTVMHLLCLLLLINVVLPAEVFLKGLLPNILFPLAVIFFSDGFPQNNVLRCILLFY